MDIIRYCDIGPDVWNEYLSKIESGCFNHTSENIEFQTSYATSVIANESFIRMQNGIPVLIACVYIDEREGVGRTVSWGGRCCPAPVVNLFLSYKMQEKYIKEALERIDEIAINYHCKDIYMQFDPLANPDSGEKMYNYNFLIKNSYRDNSGLTQMMDLRLTEKQLYADVRKGHKSNIKKGNYNITFYDSETITEDVIEEYRRIYELDAGKVTRNSEMYRNYYGFVKNGKAVVALADDGEKNVAVLIATFYGNAAYYNSYAELTEELNGVPVGHKLQWETISWLKNRGIEFYELGEQVYGLYTPGSEEEKLVNISTFKRGFGGFTLPIYRGVKCLQKEV